MPRCSFGYGSYRCSKQGIGDPPLCREHYEIIRDAEAAQEGSGMPEASFWDELFDRILDHPFVQSKVDEVMDLIKDPARLSPHYQGPGMAYAAEAPPRPHGTGKRKQRARPHAQPPPPPPTNGQVTEVQAREILHFSPQQALTCDVVRKRQRQLARLAHPDIGGSVEAMRRINDAATLLISKIR